MQRKYKTVQKLEGATQKSVDEEIKSADNVPIESISQKPKTIDEDSGPVKSDVQSSTNSTLTRKDSKLQGAEEAKEKCSCSLGTNTNVTQNENLNIQEKDTVDSVETAVVTPQSKEPENVTPNDKTSGEN